MAITITQVRIDGSQNGIGIFDYNTVADLRANFDFAWYAADNDGDANAGTFDNSIGLSDGTNPIQDAVLTEDATQTT